MPVCSASVQQGGLVLCRAASSFEIIREGAVVARSEPERLSSGRVVELGLFGLRRDEASGLVFQTRYLHGGGGRHEAEVVLRHDVVSEIGGMDCDRLDARTEEQKRHAESSWRSKRLAFSRFHEAPLEAFRFLLPSVGSVTSPFGPERRYSGLGGCEKTSIHEGVDLGAPSGSPLWAPMGGRVILSDADLYYEGGSIFLDHGRGLVSVFMHLDGVFVSSGQQVSRGDLLGITGATGRATGPHLHWGVKWRNGVDRDAGGEDFYIDPALLPGMEEFFRGG